MKIDDPMFNKLVDEFSRLDEVDAVLLGGSRTVENADKDSDFDLYIYVNREIPVSVRKTVTDKHCSYMELNNQYWETEDDGVLKESEIPVDILYRTLDWIESNLTELLIKFQVSTGYSTCIWHNFITSEILYDKAGRAAELKRRFSVKYPEELKQNIIRKNFPLLKGVMPAYFNQIRKAAERDDLVGVNHRISAFLESYFDIVFALNELTHYGEKKILTVLKEKGRIFPEGMFEDIPLLIGLIPAGEDKICSHLNKIVQRLENII